MLFGVSVPDFLHHSQVSILDHSLAVQYILLVELVFLLRVTRGEDMIWMGLVRVECSLSERVVDVFVQDGVIFNDCILLSIHYCLVR